MMIKPASERKAWILNYLRKRSLSAPYYVSTLDTNFVEDYVEFSGAKFLPMIIGAAKCKTLAKDLRELYLDGLLKRHACGIGNGDSSMGFPKWIWSYRL